jgi:hypothetical protein
MSGKTIFAITALSGLAAALPSNQYNTGYGENAPPASYGYEESSPPTYGNPGYGEQSSTDSYQSYDTTSSIYASSSSYTPAASETPSKYHHTQSEYPSEATKSTYPPYEQYSSSSSMSYPSVYPTGTAPAYPSGTGTGYYPGQSSTHSWEYPSGPGYPSAPPHAPTTYEHGQPPAPTSESYYPGYPGSPGESSCEYTPHTETVTVPELHSSWILARDPD